MARRRSKLAKGYQEGVGSVGVVVLSKPRASWGVNFMKMRFLMMSAIVAISAIVCTLAQAETTKKKSTSIKARTAACRTDCSAGHLHGTYRAYGSIDPQLKSPEGRKLFAECVRLCLDPLPGTYVQKIFIENGGSWFGETKLDCLGCHAAGKPKRFWPGVNTLPDSLKR
jgi:hypothetical protein